MTELDPQQKIALIYENLQEVLRKDIIEHVIVKENRPLAIYWGNSLRIRLTLIECTDKLTLQEQRQRANLIAATLCPCSRLRSFFVLAAESKSSLQIFMAFSTI